MCEIAYANKHRYLQHLCFVSCSTDLHSDCQRYLGTCETKDTQDYGFPGNSLLCPLCLSWPSKGRNIYMLF